MMEFAESVTVYETLILMVLTTAPMLMRMTKRNCNYAL